MIDLTGLDQIDRFCADMDLAMAELDRGISFAYTAWTQNLFTDVVKNTPQFTGDLTANWRYSVHTPDYTYVPIPNKVENMKPYWQNVDVYKRGDEPAVSIALAHMLQVSKPTWRDEVYFTNSTPIADDVQNQRIALRPVNLVAGAGLMIDYVLQKAAGGAL